MPRTLVACSVLLASALCAPQRVDAQPAAATRPSPGEAEKPDAIAAGLTTLGGIALGGTALLFGEHYLMDGGGPSPQPLGGYLMLGTSLMFLPSLGRWTGGDVRGAASKTLTRFLMTLPLAAVGAVGGLQCALGGCRGDSFAQPVLLPLTAVTVAAVLGHGIYDIVTTPFDLAHLADPPARPPTAIVAVPFAGAEVLIGNSTVFSSQCRGSIPNSARESPIPTGIALAAGALVAYRVRSLGVGLLVQESFGSLDKSCGVGFAIQSTKVYLDAGYTFAAGRLALSPHVAFGVFHLRALPRVDPGSDGFDAWASASTGLGARLGISTDWKLTRSAFAGVDAAFDVQNYGASATQGGTLAGRLGFEL